MLLGYNTPRPRREDYEGFLERLVRSLEHLGDDGLSLMLYGSFARGDYVPGRSDIDAVLIFPYNFVIPKQTMQEVALAINEALTPKYVPFQVSPLDFGTLRDGRFNSFTYEFKMYFQEEGKVILGPDYREEMECLRVKTGEESAISHNLRKCRKGFLFAEYHIWADYEQFLKDFIRTLNTASSLPKKILLMIDGITTWKKFSQTRKLQRYFPEMNLEPLERIKHLYTHPYELDKLYKQPNQILQFWGSALTFIEELLRAYIARFPAKS
ncbi:nucleotidyltransferase domain-containing protein [Candidatus Woesearchaeota archaeon]|nr:nucleotidyltransferase domain-containing protein [Candidatus Woesearchaeota archaeon]